MPIVTYRRTKQYAGRLRRMKIFHDDVQVGTVSVGQDLVVEIPPGAHVLSASMDWCRANRYVELAPREEITVEVRFVGNLYTASRLMRYRPDEAISMRAVT